MLHLPPEFLITSPGMKFRICIYTKFSSDADTTYLGNHHSSVMDSQTIINKYILSNECACVVCRKILVLVTMESYNITLY